jgi:CheY-like chemotaxis protein/HPt (histidine-containing phosphotransfer) domain-containing protein
VTRQLTELLGGELSVISEEGHGSVFSLILPTGRDISEQPLMSQDNTLDYQAGESQDAASNMFSGSVLVADDVEGNRKLMTLLLTQMGLEVTIAEDGSEALKKARSQSFDLILMDMQMPKMSGYEVTDALKRQGYKTPIVALTASTMEGDKQKCIDAQCDDYLAKPIDRRELRRILAKYLPCKTESTSKTIDSASQFFESKPCPCSISSCEQDGVNPGAIIDWNQLVERLGSEEVVREIMPLYIKDTQEHSDRLAVAVDMGDCASMASHAHALKGVGRNLGVERLSDIASQMENAGRKNDIETGTLLLNDLKTETEKVLTVLNQCDWTVKEETVL